jgi:lysozyme C
VSKIVLRIGVLAAFVLAAGCSGADDADEELVGESEDRLLAGRRVGTSELASLIRGAGFPESVVGKMICTAKYESSFYERASNKNRNGSTDYGLFQINSIHFGRSGCPSSGAALYNATTNAKCAYSIYKSQGMNAWYGYKKHKTECDRTRAPAGGAAPPSDDADSSDEATTPADDGSGPGGCWSGTLEEMVDSKTCVQSKFDNVWYQCSDTKWYRGVSGDSGPFGACSSKRAL